jgi:hypothetical protein
MDNIEIFYDSYSDVSSTKSNYLKFQGSCEDALGPKQAPLPARSVFVTINFSTKQKFILNKNQPRRQWQHFTTAEQYKIISRYRFYLNTITDSHEMYFELTKNNDIHCHVIIHNCTLCDKDLRIQSGRFFSIPVEHYHVFCDIRLVEDYDNLVLYLTGKDKKKYQTSGIPPLIKKPIDEFN